MEPQGAFPGAPHTAFVELFVRQAPLELVTASAVLAGLKRSATPAGDATVGSVASSEVPPPPAPAAMGLTLPGGGTGSGLQRITVRLLSRKASYGAAGGWPSPHQHQHQQQQPGALRLELSSESMLFFHVSTTIDEDAFAEIKEACDLSLAFTQLPGLLLQLCELLVRQPSSVLGRLMFRPDGSAALEVAQALGFKTTSLLVLPRFVPMCEAAVHAHVALRHMALRERCAAVEAELAELKALVRQRSPNLLLKGARSGWSPTKGGDALLAAGAAPSGVSTPGAGAGSLADSLLTSSPVDGGAVYVGASSGAGSLLAAGLSPAPTRAAAGSAAWLGSA